MKMLMLLLTTASAAVAQDKPDFSRIPASPQAPVRWIAEYTYPAATSTVPRRILRTTVDYSKAATRVVEALADGTSGERWFAHSFEICRVPEVAEPVVIPPDNPPDRQSADYVRVFFPQFGWVGERSYLGKEKRNGLEVYVFESPYGTASTQRAYIAVSNLLPVALESPSFELRVSFLPAEAVVLPAGFAAALEKYRSQLRAALKPVGTGD